MEKIIVPTDFSFYADKALNYAVQVARQTNGEIFLLHVCELFDTNYQTRKNLLEEYNDEVKNELFAKLENYQNSIQETEKVKVTIKLFEGDITDAIVKAANDYKADIIIMGSLGANALKNKIFGSRASDVISNSPIPVIIVPFDYVWTTPKEIIVAVNEPGLDVALLKPAFQFASIFNAEVDVVIYTDTGDDAVDFMEHSKALEKIQKKLVEVYDHLNIRPIHLSGENFNDTMQQYINRNKVQLLTMITHKRTVIEKIFNRSMTKKMAYHTSIPLLSLHA